MDASCGWGGSLRSGAWARQCANIDLLRNPALSMGCGNFSKGVFCAATRGISRDLLLYFSQIPPRP